MDGRGRVFGNIFIERFWRSLKYELIHLREFATVTELRQALTAYFEFYNQKRLYQALDYRTPAQVYWQLP